MFNLTPAELRILKPLSTPGKIQDFLDALPINHEKQGDTVQSPRVTLRVGRAHCIEGALVAALALWIHGEEPLLMDLKTKPSDDDHVIALFRRNGYYGAISKTNHSVLRYRDPLYRTPRELALSYFHEYFLIKTGQKTLVSYSKPFRLKSFGTEWVTEEDQLWEIATALDISPHYPLVPKENRRLLRNATAAEQEAASKPEWTIEHPLT